jgi:hypothetical protein
VFLCVFQKVQNLVKVGSPAEKSWLECNIQLIPAISQWTGKEVCTLCMTKLNFLVHTRSNKCIHFPCVLHVWYIISGSKITLHIMKKTTWSFRSFFPQLKSCEIPWKNCNNYFYQHIQFTKIVKCSTNPIVNFNKLILAPCNFYLFSY